MYIQRQAGTPPNCPSDPCLPREHVIDDEGQRQAGDDHDLLHAGQPPADRRRRNLEM
jgi:hypothetical protein